MDIRRVILVDVDQNKAGTWVQMQVHPTRQGARGGRARKGTYTLNLTMALE